MTLGQILFELHATQNPTNAANFIQYGLWFKFTQIYLTCDTIISLWFRSLDIQVFWTHYQPEFLRL
jgi:hypothetical protein